MTASVGCQPDAVCLRGSATAQAAGVPAVMPLDQTFSLDPGFDEIEGATGLRPVALGPDAIEMTRPSGASTGTPGASPMTPFEQADVGVGSATFTPSEGLVVVTPSATLTGTVGASAGSTTVREPAPLPALQALVLGQLPDETTVPVGPVIV
jgi:hypothetical protein